MVNEEAFKQIYAQFSLRVVHLERDLRSLSAASGSFLLLWLPASLLACLSGDFLPPGPWGVSATLLRVGVSWSCVHLYCKMWNPLKL